ncbi:M28 family peptidase [Pseudobacteriovorax antillogorgiicola]|uniref:Peptidase family M28 n=1 Tax=Pseudobacteriovorax antillogorgiicola TaxID=1513793 RepID=A0A1Y6BBI8_9BACT|nr:M28 family peptidase [Pseudobacteriovorax antillogorgiicola]TCS58655.1 peptidase M28-like protein [Pseudobacteriovorax antillogorgiicola]SME96284.1 Peptidase family M28 [Pseudobacteriovorax antillogorgiicola]
MSRYIVFLGSLSLLFLLGMQCKNRSEPASGINEAIISYSSSYDFDMKLVDRILKTLAEAPHPLGSQRQKAIAAYLSEQGKNLGLTMYTDSFEAQVPNPVLLARPDAPSATTLDKTGYNVYGATDPSAKCVYLVGSHYDTKYMENIVYRGANDSGSSSAAMFALAKALKSWDQRTPCGYFMIWFDGEESYLPQWNDGLYRHPAKSQDNTYGSRHLANQLSQCNQGNTSLCLPTSFGGAEVKGLVLLDMIGSKNISITRDLNSSSDWLNLALQLDKVLNLSIIGTQATAVEDDHVPFRKRGLPALNLIDFNHLELWHVEGDDYEKVDLGSIEKANRLALALLLTLNKDKPN